MNKISKHLLLLIATILATSYSYADIKESVKWQKSLIQIDKNTVELKFTATIEMGWHMYGLNIPAGGPIATSFSYEESGSYTLKGKISPSKKAKTKFDDTFEMNVELFDGKVVFTQQVTINNKPTKIKGSIEFMACDDTRCLPPDEFEFEFDIKADVTNAAETTNNKEESNKVAELVPETKAIKDLSAQKGENATKETNNTEIADHDIDEAPIHDKNQEQLIDAETEKPNKEKSSWWVLFWEGFGKGILVIFTPCVFPIIPLTIAFFMQGNSTRKRIFQAIFFGLTIVAVYAFVGLIVGLTKFNITAALTHWIANLIITGVLLIFAASFFGMFELVLPGSISSKLDQKVDKGGLLAPFFLALTTAVVSFACVGPFAGVALARAMTGEIAAPVIALSGFSSAFALPFVILAIFPALLKKMPKSGGWLNSFKVFFAFIILAASFIFLGNTQFKVFNRDVILSLNIITFALLGFYLLGKLKFAHDSELPHIKVPRLILAILSFSFAVYLLPGLFGSPLKAIAPILPPPETSELSISASPLSGGTLDELGTTGFIGNCKDKPRHSEFLDLPLGIKGYFDYKEGLACAKKLNRPVLLDFVGHSCKNCKKMYASVWSDQRVQNILNNEYVVIALYTDDKTELPKDEWYTSEFDGRVKKTIGKQNIDFELTRFKTNALPMYVVLNHNEEIITSQEQYTYNSNIEDFIDYLEEGIKNFKKE